MNKFYRARAALSAGVLLAGLWTGAMALFTDSATSEGSFSNGTVRIGLSPSTTLFNVTNMAPGDVRYAGLSVANSGSLQMRYRMTSAPVSDSDPTYPLSNQLSGEVRTVPGGCDAAAFASGTAVAGPGALGSLSIPSARTLAAGASENLCFRVELPLSTSNEYQGDSTTVRFSFYAEQTANN